MEWLVVLLGIVGAIVGVIVFILAAIGIVIINIGEGIKGFLMKDRK